MWNCFDSFVVASSLAQTFLSDTMPDLDLGVARMVRLVRLVRFVRIVRFLPEMRTVQ
jgi:hypothetical protein